MQVMLSGTQMVTNWQGTVLQEYLAAAVCGAVTSCSRLHLGLPCALPYSSLRTSLLLIVPRMPASKDQQSLALLMEPVGAAVSHLSDALSLYWQGL